MSDVYGPPIPYRWWLQTGRLPDGAPYLTVVAESGDWWHPQVWRLPGPAASFSIGVSRPDGAADWLRNIWEEADLDRAGRAWRVDNRARPRARRRPRRR